MELESSDLIKNGLEDSKSFYEFLLQEAEVYGFCEPQKSKWIKYMMEDFSRGESLVKNLLSHFNILSTAEFRALDIGCGYGGQLIALKQHFKKVSGIDIIQNRVKYSKKRVVGAKVVQGTVTKLPWPDCHFNLIICNDVFEHISYDQQQLAATELIRVLKPGGFGFLAVPNRFQLIDEHSSVWFASWLPKTIRYLYIKAVRTNLNFTHCYERSGYGWKRLFTAQGLKVTLKASRIKEKWFLPAQRWKIFFTKT